MFHLALLLLYARLIHYDYPSLFALLFVAIARVALLILSPVRLSVLILVSFGTLVLHTRLIHYYHYSFVLLFVAIVRAVHFIYSCLP